jgi:hypothetical protein
MREISACFESGRFTQAIRAILKRKLEFRGKGYRVYLIITLGVVYVLVLGKSHEQHPYDG